MYTVGYIELDFKTHKIICIFHGCAFVCVKVFFFRWSRRIHIKFMNLAASEEDRRKCASGSEQRDSISPVTFHSYLKRLETNVTNLTWTVVLYDLLNIFIHFLNLS